MIDRQLIQVGGVYNKIVKVDQEEREFKIKIIEINPQSVLVEWEGVQKTLMIGR